MAIQNIKLNKIFSRHNNLKFKREDFYVRINGYGKNKEWADEIIKTADLAANLIKRETSGENVLKIITKGVSRANNKVLEISKRLYTGILRYKRENWTCFPSEVTTKYSINRYKGYETRLDKMKGIKITPPQNGIGISKPAIVDGEKQIVHGCSSCVNFSLDYIFNLYKNLFPKYLNKKLTTENLDDINSTVAEIRWVLAHSTPWMRGSDAIANVFMRAIYKALGIKSYPLNKGISLDLEAYCTTLKDYKTKFPDYFINKPTIID